AYWFSPRRVAAAEVLTLFLLGFAAMWTSRMLVWWAPIAAGCLALHAHAAVRQYLNSVGGFLRNPRIAGFGETGLHCSDNSPRSGRWTLVSIVLAWSFFGLTPFGQRLLHG